VQRAPRISRKTCRAIGRVGGDLHDPSDRSRYMRGATNGVVDAAEKQS